MSVYLQTLDVNLATGVKGLVSWADVIAGTQSIIGGWKTLGCVFCQRKAVWISQHL